jgi:hypothetical protein
MATKQLTKKQPPARPSFWKSPSGIATGAAIAIGGVAAMLTLSAKQAAATPTTPPVPPTVMGTPQAYGTNASGQTQWINFQPATANQVGANATFTGGYYQFEVLSSQSAMAITTALAAVGWDAIAIAADPYTANNWLVSAQWTGYPGAVVVATTPPAIFFLDGGSLATWQINPAVLPASLGSAIPAAPQANGTAASPMVAGDWYGFSIRTAFLQTAGTSTNPAATEVATLLSAAGWTSPMVTAVAGDPNNDTWNVIAQLPAGTTPLVNILTDAPPLWIYVTALTDMGVTQPAAPASTMPGVLTASTL